MERGVEERTPHRLWIYTKVWTVGFMCIALEGPDARGETTSTSPHCTSVPWAVREKKNKIFPVEEHRCFLQITSKKGYKRSFPLQRSPWEVDFTGHQQRPVS